MTLKVIDIQGGTGKHEGKLGAFSVEGEDEESFLIKCWKWINRRTRDNYQAAKDKLIGRLIEVRLAG